MEPAARFAASPLNCPSLIAGPSPPRRCCGCCRAVWASQRIINGLSCITKKRRGRKKKIRERERSKKKRRRRKGEGRQRSQSSPSASVPAPLLRSPPSLDSRRRREEKRREELSPPSAACRSRRLAPFQQSKTRIILQRLGLAAAPLPLVCLSPFSSVPHLLTLLIPKSDLAPPHCARRQPLPGALATSAWP